MKVVSDLEADGASMDGTLVIQAPVIHHISPNGEGNLSKSTLINVTVNLRQKKNFYREWALVRASNASLFSGILDINFHSTLQGKI